MNYQIKKTLLSSALLASTSFALSVPGIAQAQDAAAVDDVIIVSGSRGKPRAITDSPVPVDVISEEEIFNVPFTDTNDILKTLVPSYSLSRQPISVSIAAHSCGILSKTVRCNTAIGVSRRPCPVRNASLGRRPLV